MRTYIVVAVLDEEGNALAGGAVAARVLLQAELGRGHVVEQLAVGEGAAGQRVHDGGAAGVVRVDGGEEGQAGQRRRHSDARTLSRAGEAAGEGAGEEAASPHGGDEEPRTRGRATQHPSLRGEMLAGRGRRGGEGAVCRRFDAALAR